MIFNMNSLLSYTFLYHLKNLIQTFLLSKKHPNMNKDHRWSIHRWTMWVAYKEIGREIVSCTFFVIRKFLSTINLQKNELGNSRAKPVCYCTIPLDPFYTSESHDSLFQNVQVKHWLMFQSHMVYYSYFTYD